jgi:hypothetical protein
MFRRIYRLKHDVTATAIDDDEHARFEDDTTLPAGAEFTIAADKRTWPPRPDSQLYYTVEYRNVLYKVEAGVLEAEMEPAAA